MLASTKAMITTLTQAAPSRPNPMDQSDVIAFLRDPSSYAGGVDTVECIETHGAIVFLAGNLAYKLKRAVKLPYMDFSTPERRAAACRHEVERNRMTAPETYLEALAITRAPSGRLSLGGDGKPVDWVVVMKRFEQEDLLANLQVGMRWIARSWRRWLIISRPITGGRSQPTG